MKFKKPENSNYCGTVVKIDNIVNLENCDNVQGTIIFGEQVIISKETKIGDVGIYFPPECQLSNEFLKNNNLYRDKTLNIDENKKGYFELNGRIRTVKFRGNKSVGFWIPLNSLNFTTFTTSDFEVGDEFDEILGINICKKYVSPKPQQKLNGTKKGRKRLRDSKLIQNQFRFHDDTLQLAKNIHKLNSNDLISITYKLHGTSVIITKLLCKKKLNLFYKLLKFLRIKVIDYEYSNLYSSRKVIKNDDFTDVAKREGWYKEDVWGLANEKLQPYLKDGMSIYAEVVGYLPSGGYIQKPFDYGCTQGEFEVYIYRITQTNIVGDVFEFSCKQVQDWCKERGLKAVPELYYGKLNDIFDWKEGWRSGYYNDDLTFETNFINLLREKYLERDCYMCKNKLPAEGIVVRPERLEFEAYKLKSFRFLELESKNLDKGEEDIESQEDSTNDQNLEEI